MKFRPNIRAPLRKPGHVSHVDACFLPPSGNSLTYLPSKTPFFSSMSTHASGFPSSGLVCSQIPAAVGSASATAPDIAERTIDAATIILVLTAPVLRGGCRLCLAMRNSKAGITVSQRPRVFNPHPCPDSAGEFYNQCPPPPPPAICGRRISSASQIVPR